MKEIAPRWDLRIVKTENGYRVNWLDVEEEAVVVREVVFEEANEEFGELEAMTNLLWFVSQHFGVMFSKHNQRNLVIEIQQTNTN